MALNPAVLVDTAWNQPTSILNPGPRSATAALFQSRARNTIYSKEKGIEINNSNQQTNHRNSGPKTIMMLQRREKRNSSTYQGV